MKAFTATLLGQGARRTDFNNCKTGELLYLGFECDSDEKPDDKCGCKRSFCGMETHKATTTAVVAEVNMTHEQWTRHYLTSMQSAGWIKSFNEPLARDFEKDAVEWIELMSRFPVGTVVEKRGRKIETRPMGLPAEAR